MSEGRKSESLRLHEIVFVDKFTLNDCESGTARDILKKEGYPDYSIKRMLSVAMSYYKGELD